MSDEEYAEPPPPSPERVARRAVILSTVCCRGFTEGDRSNPAGAADLAKHSHDWLLSLNVEGDLSEWEAGLLTAPFGTLTDRDRINASWLSEAVAIFAWALGKAELPAFDQQCDPAETANNLGFLASIGETALNSSALRPFEELHEYNEFIYNLHWRIRDFSLNRNAYDFERLARKAWGEPVLRHGLILSERDISIGGVPLSKAAEEDWRKVASTTQERHRASNWLIGYASEDFYEVTTDT